MPSVWIIFATIHFNQTASQNKALHAGAGPRIHADCQASVIGLLDLAEKGGDFFEKKYPFRFGTMIRWRDGYWPAFDADVLPFLRDACDLYFRCRK